MRRTKLTILETLADRVDRLIVGGGIANTFLAAMGKPIGKSLSEPDPVGAARTIIDKMKARGADVPSLARSFRRTPRQAPSASTTCSPTTRSSTSARKPAS